MKITLIGVGSFVFGPSAIYDAIAEHDLPDLELALVDNDIEIATLMAGFARRLSRDRARDVVITVHADWREALDGSDFVCMSAAVDLTGRFQRDCEIIAANYPDHLVTEFGGVAGISYLLRQSALITSLAGDMRRQCPTALLLMSSNPLARLSEIAQVAGVQTIGFCSNSMKGYGLIGRLLQGWDEGYPWPLAVERYEATMAGANHFTFLVSLRDRLTGEDVLSDLTEAAALSGGLGPVTTELLSTTGFLTTNGDDHIRDFLTPAPETKALAFNAHGGPEERARRRRLLAAAGAGEGPAEHLIAHRAWERPIAFAAAYAGLGERAFHSVNLPNMGQIVGVRHGAFVETPADVSRRVVAPRVVSLPEPIRVLTEQTVSLSHQTVEAVMTYEVNSILASLAADPTILDFGQASTALLACMVANLDLIGDWR